MSRSIRRNIIREILDDQFTEGEKNREAYFRSERRKSAMKRQDTEREKLLKKAYRDEFGKD